MSTATLLIGLFILAGIVFFGYKASDYIVSASDPKNQPRFFCQIPKGKSVTIMVGGVPSMYLGELGHNLYLDRKTGKSVPRDKMTEEQKDREIEFLYYVLKKTLGIAWIGFVGKVLVEELEFKEEKDGKLEKRVISTPYVKFQHAYSEFIDDLDTIDKFAVGLHIQVTIRVHNIPQLRFTQGKNWLIAIFGDIRSAVKDYVSNMSYADLMKEKTESANSKFLDTIMALNAEDVGNPSLLERYGVEIVAVNLIDVKPKDERMRLATTEKFVSEELGKKMRTDAQNAADVLKISSEAEANAINTKAKAEENKIKLVGMAQVEVDKARVKAYNDNPPEIAWPKAIGETKGTFVLDPKSVPFFPIQPNK